VQLPKITALKPPWLSGPEPALAWVGHEVRRVDRRTAASNRLL